MAFRVVVIISGRGSNMEALVKKQNNYEISAVISNNPEAPGLEIAKDLGVPTQCFPRKNYPSVVAQKGAIFDAVCKGNPDLVALAGYMQIVEAQFVETYFGRLINIHPSLLPAYPGLDTHERVIAAGEKYHGCTVHFLDQWVDTGPLIAQAKIEVPSQIDPHTLAELVIKREHEIYPWVVNQIAIGNISLQGRRVLYAEATTSEAAKLGFSIF